MTNYLTHVSGVLLFALGAARMIVPNIEVFGKAISLLAPSVQLGGMEVMIIGMGLMTMSNIPFSKSK